MPKIGSEKLLLYTNTIVTNLAWTERLDKTFFPDSPGIFWVNEDWTSQHTSAAAAPLSVYLLDFESIINS
jgi:hypothetical protein